MKPIGILAFLMVLAAGAQPSWSQDAQKGKEVFQGCAACHEVGPDAKNKAGPVLNGIVGKKAAAVPGYDYSRAMKRAAADGLTWTEANLTAYVESPSKFMPNGLMFYRGLKDPQQVKDLIAYLKTQQ